MFKQRLLTSTILGIFVIGLVLMASETAFRVMLMLLLLIASWEWSKLISIQTILVRIVYSLIILTLIHYVLLLEVVYLLGFVTICWLLLLSAVIYYPRSEVICSNQWLSAILGIVIFLGYGTGLIELRGQQQGAELVIYLITIVLLADVGAYAVGKLVGKHKLAPKVSPGKTWEGALFGLLLAMIVSVGGGVYFSIHGQQWVSWLLLALLTVVASVIGDLSESLFKRCKGVKDSGKLLPGHGGILDRIDGHLAAAPVFVFFFMLIRKFLG